VVDIGADEVVCIYPARIVCGNPVHFSTLQASYDSAGDGDIIQSQDLVFNEDVYMDLNKSVTLQGGHSCYYSDVQGKTILNGNMTISNGTVSIENFILQ
jgi:hypothetical protein